jgi:iron complex outermembrane receptor protein
MPVRYPLFVLLFPLTAFAAETLDEVTVTGTREGQLLSETLASVKVISGATLRQDKPSHPSQVLGQSPWVWVNVTGGEGHMTAIRQPLTTNPVYLYLEDGILSRCTGFFNHNALYEINVPQAGGIEVTRGPGTALYGSNAIGGVVNVLTRPAPSQFEAELAAEVGEYGWRRPRRRRTRPSNASCPAAPRPSSRPAPVVPSS